MGKDILSRPPIPGKRTDAINTMSIRPKSSSNKPSQICYFEFQPSVYEEAITEEIKELLSDSKRLIDHIPPGSLSGPEQATIIKKANGLVQEWNTG